MTTATDTIRKAPSWLHGAVFYSKGEVTAFKKYYPDQIEVEEKKIRNPWQGKYARWNISEYKLKLTRKLKKKVKK
jgi:hypothetical protein